MAIHPTAIISPKAQIDPTTEIGPYVIIDDEVTIGPHCRIAPHVHINAYTTIGANNEIHTAAVLGDTPQDRAFKPCRSYLEIGDDNVIRESVSIHRGTATESTTRIGNHCFIMGYSHIAHNCTIGNDVTIANTAALGGYVDVGNGAFLSAHSLFHQFVRLGRLCMISGATRQKRDVPPFLTSDFENGVVGVNVVGLRRAGISSQDISQLRAAYRRIYRTGALVRKATDELADENSHPLVREMIDFIRAPSKRGITGAPGQNRRITADTAEPSPES